MNKVSLSIIFQKKLIQWILVPGLLVTLGTVCIIGISHKNSMENEILQLSKSLSQDVDYYMEGAQDILQSVAIMSGKHNAVDYNEFFKKLHNNFSRFERLILLDKDGNIVAVYPKMVMGADLPIRFSGKNNRDHTLTSPVLSYHSGKLVVFLSLPVEGGGKIVAELSLGALQTFIYSFMSPERIIILTDSYGNIVVHPNHDQVMNRSNLGLLELFKKFDNSGHGKFYRANGKLYFGYISKIPVTGWKLLVACPSGAIFKPAVTLGLITGLIIICFFILLTIGIRKEFRLRVVAPMVKYIKKLSALAEGIYPTASSQETEFYELNEFGKVFDSMSEKVREREQDLRVSKAYFQSVIDSMPSALIRIDDKMIVCQCNKKVKEIFPDVCFGIVSVKVENFFLGQTEILNAISEARDLNIPRILERRNIDNNLHNVYDVTVFPLQDSELAGVVVRIDDVTSRARMEEVMVQTEKMMSVGGLAAGMAHEINNPLGGILQGAQNLERRFLPEIKANVEAATRAGCSMESLQQYLKYRKILGIIAGIKDSGLRASSIVSNMLEFSKPGKDIVTTVSVAELINAALELAAKDYDLKKKYDFLHVRIVREFDPDLPDIICSRTEIEQVFFNLFKNAAQAMAEHGYHGTEPVITVRTAINNSGITIEVADNGPGIDPETRRRVFEPFYTTKSPESGTGLGLSVSYFIITQNHGGTFTVDSHLGSGAKFIITLPVNKNEK